MALVQTTPEYILSRLRGKNVKEEGDVYGEMALLFDLANDKNWYHQDTWDKMSFGKVKGKRQIVFKTSYAAVMRIIQSKSRNKFVSSMVTDVKSGEHKGEKNIKTDGKPHIILKLGEQVVKFQGTKTTGASKGSKISASTMTKMQELGSAWIFYQALNQGKSWDNWLQLKEDPDVTKVVGDIWSHYKGDWDEDGDEWAMNFYIQQKALLRKLGGQACCQFDQYTHSNEYKLPGMSGDSFMDWISERVNKMGITGKDNWNPADIWLIQSKYEQRARKFIEKTLNTSLPDEIKRDQVNHYMRGLFRSKIIFGISLKKVTTDPAHVVYFNHNTEFFKKNWVGEGYGGYGTDDTIMKYDSAVCKLGLSKKTGRDIIETQDTKWYVKDNVAGGATYNFQIKGNESTDFSGLKYEPTAEGHGEARLGKATVELVIALLKDHGKTFDKSKDSYPKNADEFIAGKGSDGKGWKHWIDILCKNGVDLGKANDCQEGYDNLLKVFHPEKGTSFIANVKCQQIKWLGLFFSIDSKDRDKFATNMVWTAMKAGRRYGPYAKIY